jgi:glycosyltransferase involved in cell wall biosynthesis
MLPKLIDEEEMFYNLDYEKYELYDKERRGMKIGIDCRLWNETGVGRYTRNLVSELSKLDKKNNYVLFVLSKDEDSVKSLINNSHFEVQSTNIRWHTFKEQLEFPKVLGKENLDLVHFPYFSVPVFYNRPFVVTIHDLIVNHFSTGHASTLPLPFYEIKLAAYKFVLNETSRRAKKIIAISNATKKEIEDHLRIKGDKIAVIYEGVDKKLQEKRDNGNSFIKGKYFLYVGNAYPHKNIEKLLEAFGMLNSDVNLVLVGKEDTFWRRIKEKAKRMNFSKRIIFLQDVGDMELSNLYKNALALVVPSLMEGFGLPSLEAMANKCLVLASDIPSLREICEDAAIYFDPRKVSDIKKQMEEVSSNNSNVYNDKRKEGLKRAKSFSWEKTARETLKIYESCVSL